VIATQPLKNQIEGLVDVYSMLFEGFKMGPLKQSYQSMRGLQTCQKVREESLFEGLRTQPLLEATSLRAYNSLSRAIDDFTCFVTFPCWSCLPLFSLTSPLSGPLSFIP